MRQSIPTAAVLAAQFLLAAAAPVLLAAAAPAQLQPAAPEAGRALMRFPTQHGNQVAFVAYGNLWVVDRTGGTARRLTADAGQDLMPRYSPDGRWIAFTAHYQGN